MRIRIKHKNRPIAMSITMVLGIAIAFLVVEYNDGGPQKFRIGGTEYSITNQAINNANNPKTSQFQSRLMSGGSNSSIAALFGSNQGNKSGNIFSSIAGIAKLGGAKNISMADIGKYASMSNSELKNVYSGLSASDKAKVMQNKSQIKAILGR